MHAIHTLLADRSMQRYISLPVYIWDRGKGRAYFFKFSNFFYFYMSSTTSFLYTLATEISQSIMELQLYGIVNKIFYMKISHGVTVRGLNV